MTDQRKRLDQIMQNSTFKVLSEYRPRKGWIKAVRESIGMTAQQLATRMKLKNHASIFAFEKREKEKTITLKAIEDAAKAMGCNLVYAIVPAGKSFDSLVEERALKIAAQMIRKVSHSMKLENQSVTQDYQSQQTQELVKELKEKLDPRLWE